MAYTQTDLDAIRAARLRGIREVEFRGPDGRGRRTTFQSDAEMRQVEIDIAADLASTSTTRRPKRAFMVGTTGW